jgi:hypothetical protein
MSGRPRRASAARSWTPVDQLSELARALLSDDLGDRDAVPAHVADRVTALAAQWVEHGFTAQTVGPWAELTPACAAYLAGRGVPPHALDQLVDVGGSAGPLTVRTALSTGRLTDEQAYDLLAGSADAASSRQTPRAPVVSTTDPPAPDGAARARMAPAPAVFSHAGTDHTGHTGHTGDRDRAERPGPADRPSRTPFRS